MSENRAVLIPVPGLHLDFGGNRGESAADLGLPSWFVPDLGSASVRRIVSFLDCPQTPHPNHTLSFPGEMPVTHPQQDVFVLC